MERLLAGWIADPVVLLGLALGAGIYARGWRGRAGRAGRRARPSWRAWCYAAGLVVLAVALLSPVGTLGDELFALHMVQHLLLTIVVPPLLLFGAPLLPLLWGLPSRERDGVARLFLAPRAPVRRLFDVLGHPAVAVVLHLGVVVVWHVPAFYDAAQGRTFTHDLEHLLFIGTALLYWWPIIHPSGGRRRLGYALAIPYVFLAMMVTQVLGALLTFATTPLYATYREAPRVSSLSPLEDQQLAGLLMWVPTGLLYIAAMLTLLVLFLHDQERRQIEAERREREAGAGDGAAASLTARRPA